MPRAEPETYLSFKLKFSERSHRRMGSAIRTIWVWNGPYSKEYDPSLLLFCWSSTFVVLYEYITAYHQFYLEIMPPVYSKGSLVFGHLSTQLSAVTKGLFSIQFMASSIWSISAFLFSIFHYNSLWNTSGHQCYHQSCSCLPPTKVYIVHNVAYARATLQPGCEVLAKLKDFSLIFAKLPVFCSGLQCLFKSNVKSHFFCSDVLVLKCVLHFLSQFCTITFTDSWFVTLHFCLVRGISSFFENCLDKVSSSEISMALGLETSTQYY